MHQRFPKAFTPALVSLLNPALAPPQRAAVNGPSNVLLASAAIGPANTAPGTAAPATTPSQLPAELKEKEDAARVARQRPVLRVCAELALVGIIRDGPGRSGGEWIMKALKDLVGSY